MAYVEYYDRTCQPLMQRQSRFPLEEDDDRIVLTTCMTAYE